MDVLTPIVQTSSATTMANFKLYLPFQPAGDQPQAIQKLEEGLKRGLQHQTLFGVTGSGKTYTVANVIEKIQKPTLVFSHNKTISELCAMKQC